MPFLDPTSRALAAPVVQSRELLVVRQPRSASAIPVDDDADALADLSTGASVLDRRALNDHEIRAVVVWLDTPGRMAGRGDLVVVHRSEHFEVWSVTR